jgi:hypothetical protein
VTSQTESGILAFGWSAIERHCWLMNSTSRALGKEQAAGRQGDDISNEVLAFGWSAIERHCWLMNPTSRALGKEQAAGRQGDDISNEVLARLDSTYVTPGLQSSPLIPECNIYLRILVVAFIECDLAQHVSSRGGCVLRINYPRQILIVIGRLR